MSETPQKINIRMKLEFRLRFVKTREPELKLKEQRSDSSKLSFLSLRR